MSAVNTWVVECRSNITSVGAMESSGLWTAPTALGCSFALLLAVRLYCSRGGELFALRGSEEVVESSLSRFLTLSTGGIAIFATLSYYQVYDLIPTEVYAWTLPELPRLLDQNVRPHLTYVDVAFPRPTQWVGVIIVNLASLLLWSVHSAMKNAWAPVITVKPNQELVSHGPFGIVRHPMYSCLVILSIGGFLVTGNLVLTVCWACWTLTVVLRIPEEERALLSAFGSQYSAYKRRVPWKLIPYLFWWFVWFLQFICSLPLYSLVLFSVEGVSFFSPQNCACSFLLFPSLLPLLSKLVLWVPPTQCHNEHVSALRFW